MMLLFFARHMLMHSHASFLSFFIIPSACSGVFLFFSLIFLLYHPRNLSLQGTWYLVMVLLLLFLLLLLEIGSVIRNSKRILRRTFVTRWFTRNATSFCLIFQTLLYLMHLALGVRNLCMRNLLDVLAFLYRSSTPTYMLSIPLFPSLLWYSEEHVL